MATGRPVARYLFMVTIAVCSFQTDNKSLAGTVPTASEGPPALNSTRRQGCNSNMDDTDIDTAYVFLCTMASNDSYIRWYLVHGDTSDVLATCRPSTNHCLNPFHCANASLNGTTSVLKIAAAYWESTGGEVECRESINNTETRVPLNVTASQPKAVSNSTRSRETTVLGTTNMTTVFSPVITMMKTTPHSQESFTSTTAIPLNNITTTVRVTTRATSTLSSGRATTYEAIRNQTTVESTLAVLTRATSTPKSGTTETSQRSGKTTTPHISNNQSTRGTGPINSPSTNGKLTITETLVETPTPKNTLSGTISAATETATITSTNTWNSQTALGNMLNGTTIQLNEVSGGTTDTGTSGTQTTKLTFVSGESTGMHAQLTGDVTVENTLDDKMTPVTTNSKTTETISPTRETSEPRTAERETSTLNTGTGQTTAKGQLENEQSTAEMLNDRTTAEYAVDYITTTGDFSLNTTPGRESSVFPSDRQNTTTKEKQKWDLTTAYTSSLTEVADVKSQSSSISFVTHESHTTDSQSSKPNLVAAVAGSCSAVAVICLAVAIILAVYKIKIKNKNRVNPAITREDEESKSQTGYSQEMSSRTSKLDQSDTPAKNITDLPLFVNETSLSREVSRSSWTSSASSNNQGPVSKANQASGSKDEAKKTFADLAQRIMSEDSKLEGSANKTGSSTLGNAYSNPSTTERQAVGESKDVYTLVNKRKRMAKPSEEECIRNVSEDENRSPSIEEFADVGNSKTTDLSNHLYPSQADMYAVVDKSKKRRILKDMAIVPSDEQREATLDMNREERADNNGDSQRESFSQNAFVDDEKKNQDAHVYAKINKSPKKPVLKEPARNSTEDSQNRFSHSDESVRDIQESHLRQNSHASLTSSDDLSADESIPLPKPRLKKLAAKSEETKRMELKQLPPLRLAVKAFPDQLGDV